MMQATIYLESVITAFDGAFLAKRRSAEKNGFSISSIHTHQSRCSKVPNENGILGLEKASCGTIVNVAKNSSLYCGAVHISRTSRGPC